MGHMSYELNVEREGAATDKEGDIFNLPQGTKRKNKETEDSEMSVH